MNVAHQKSPRLPEIDVLKGIAIILVVFFHAVFDLEHFLEWELRTDLGILAWIGRIAAVLFITLAGFSFGFQYQRTRQEGRLYPFRKVLLRGLLLGLCALSITVVTYLTVPEGMIVFGILHFLALVQFIGYLTARLGIGNLVLAAFVFLLEPLISTMSVSHFYLIWLGITPETFMTFDYFPLIPWSGYYLIGLYLGELYIKHKLHFMSPSVAQLPLIRFSAFLGRHTLIIYLIHQPLLIAGFSLYQFLFQY